MTLHITGINPTDAWAQAIDLLSGQPARAAYHLAVRISSSDADEAKVAAVDRLLAARGKQSVETVANTIFPSRLAATSADVSELAERYRRLYPRLRKFPGNTQGGTYFGRLVQFPEGGDRSDQLTYTVGKMRRESEHASRKSSIYECAIYSPKRDAGKATGFPCLSSCSFHLDHETRAVHLLAIYRNHSFFERALGNYFGLTRLRDYVADQIGFGAGELMVISGHAKIEAAFTELKHLIANSPF